MSYKREKEALRKLVLDKRHAEAYYERVKNEKPLCQDKLYSAMHMLNEIDKEIIKRDIRELLNDY